MISAIDAQAANASPEARRRLYAIFIEAPRQLPSDDPRQDLTLDPITPLFFSGFEDRADGSLPDEQEALRRRSLPRPRRT